MITSNLKRQIFGLVLFLSVCGVYSQQPNLSEEENKAKAQELFDAKNYQEAMPLYAQLVSVYSNNSEYNYKFGVCSLFGDRTDRRRPIRYLNKALKTMANNAELNYYLGLAYYQNQEFANAMKYLNLYLAKLDPASSERPVILEQVNACLNGMNLEHKNLISEIISTSEFQLDNYHRAYRADELDGMLILKPENFVSAKEKNSGENSFVYISEPKGTIYFSGYVKGAESNKDIYKVAMDENGGWGTPEKISDKINSMFDEEYPVLTNGGTILYFCSKGHNSLGGYDIFKSEYDAANNSFSEPENLGMGINSPFDDILFVPDKSGEFAYFSTNRDNLNNAINVYKVRLSESAVGEEIMLAQNNASKNQSNSGQSSQSEGKTVQSKEVKTEIAQNTQPKVAPTEKAASLKRDKSSLNQMADTAYLLISKTKSAVRSLTNKRDRANAICAKKKEEAKELELKLDQDLAKIHEFTGEEEFELALQQSIDLKKQIVQKRKSAEHANLIAWKIGKYIKIKNAELQKLKEDAGSVQSLAVSGDIEQTQIVYSELKSRYNAADTLQDLSADILQIAQGSTSYTVPEKALAFAENLRQGFLNNTLIADATAAKPKIDASIPIVTVDNRTTNPVPQPTPKVIAAKQVEAVQFADNNTIIPEGEALDLNFAIDAIKADKVVEQVVFAHVDNDIDIDETYLEIRFNLDIVKPEKLVEMIAFNDSEIKVDEELEIIIEKEIITDPIIEQVLFAETSSDIEIEDPSLELRYDVDIIEASPAIEMIAFNDSELIIEEDLEVNIEKEIITDLLVEQILFAETSFDIENEDPSLELRYDVDVIEASPAIEMIAFNDSELIIEEDLEINLEKEIITDPIVEQVLFAETSSDIEIEEPSLELSFDSDVIEAAPAVKMIVLNKVEEEINIEEDLEINIENEFITDLLVEQVIFAETSTDIEIEDPSLELRFNVDAIEASPTVEMIAFNDSENELNIDEEIEVSLEKEVQVVSLVEPVFLASNSFDIEMDDPSLELNFEADVITALPVVQAIAYTSSDEFMEEEEALELSYSIDRKRMPAYSLIQPIRKESYADMIEVEDDDLEINIDNDLEEIKVANIVNSIPMTFNDDIIVDEESIELNFSVDIIIPANIIEPVYVSFTDESFTMYEELEISIDVAPVTPVETAYIYTLVKPVYKEKMTSIDTWPEEATLEFSNDFNNLESNELIAPVNYVDIATTTELENELEINYSVDEQDYAQQLATAISSLKKRLETEPVNSMPAIGVDLFYLRETLEIANDIETSRTDFEMLTLALTNPEDLSYEELLFAASLAQNPADKLNIFYQAFIHIDRDWRAFNNAAISAINIQDLETAECLLYQASLISNKNGKIVNNMGILACYKNEFETAKELFSTASSYGVNSDYNLQVVQNLYDSNIESPNNFRQELGDHNYYEVLGDASEIKND